MTMASEDIYEEDFFIYLTIEGTPYEDVEIKVSDPNKAIRDQIASIVQVFELPKMDNGGMPIQYLLGMTHEDGNEPEILELEDEDGREQAIIDYNIQPGDHLHLCSIPVPGFHRKMIGDLTITNKSWSVKWIIKREMKRLGYVRYINWPRCSFNPHFDYYRKNECLYVNPYENFIYSIFLVPKIWHDVREGDNNEDGDYLLSPLYRDQMDGIYKRLDEYDNNTIQYKLLAEAIAFLPYKQKKAGRIRMFMTKFNIITNK